MQHLCGIFILRLCHMQDVRIQKTCFAFMKLYLFSWNEVGDRTTIDNEQFSCFMPVPGNESVWVVGYIRNGRDIGKPIFKVRKKFFF